MTLQDGGGAVSRTEALELCGRAAAGNRRAAESLVRLTLPTVKHVATRLTRTRCDADDAAQDALLEVVRSASGYRGDGSLLGWAHRIAIRSVLRWRRRHGTVAATAVEADDLETPAASTATIDELPRPLVAYLDALPDAQRTALVLRHSMGCTLPEIASLTKSPLPTVKSRIQTSMQSIRRAIRRDLRFGGEKVGT